MSQARESLKQHTTALNWLASRTTDNPSFMEYAFQRAFWRNEKDILSMPWMNATTNQIKLDFTVSKAYQASTEDWLSKFQACKTITWYKEDTDNWHFDSCWQLYLTQETLLLKQFNILYYGNLQHFQFFFLMPPERNWNDMLERSPQRNTFSYQYLMGSSDSSHLEAGFFFPIL